MTLDKNMTSQTHYLIIGQGGVGKSVALALAEVGYQVSTLATTPKHYPALPNLTFYQGCAQELTDAFFAPFSHVAIIVSPKSSQASAAIRSADHGASQAISADERITAYQDSYLAIAKRVAALATSESLMRVLFVSSTSVYGQNDGQWVDEHTPAIPADPTAQVLLDSERVLKDAFGDRAIIVRPSGIYGVHRRYMIRLAMAQTADSGDDHLGAELGLGRPKLQGVKDHRLHYGNRIMDSDLVKIITKALTDPKPKPLYLASDEGPATTQVVLDFILQALGQGASASDAQDTRQSQLPSERQRMTGKRIKGNVSDCLEYPDYQAGYRFICQMLTDQGHI